MAESRRLRTQADEHGNRPDDCGHCTLLPGVNGPVRAVQTGCPVHGDWVRTQAERDADGTAWRARREAAHDEIDARVAPEHADFVKGVYDRLNAPKPPPDKSWLQTEPAPRRRWWHPYTRPTRKD